MAVGTRGYYGAAGQDALTGGYNRQGFVQKAEHILQNANEDDNYAILFFNIKNFKAVNELFGIDLGDFILREFYEDLKNSQLDPVVTARAEADHFGVPCETGKSG